MVKMEKPEVCSVCGSKDLTYQEQVPIGQFLGDDIKPWTTNKWLCNNCNSGAPYSD